MRPTLGAPLAHASHLFSVRPSRHEAIV